MAYQAMGVAITNAMAIHLMKIIFNIWFSLVVCYLYL
jgi:hypothetical protein